MKKIRNPKITVDIIIVIKDRGIILIERKNPPYGWALPGGFVDYGETLENAAIREAKEETSLDIFDLKQFHAYSDPKRDPRSHTISVIFTAKSKGEPKADSDAKSIKVYNQNNLPKLVFDHGKILEDYYSRRTGVSPVK